MAEEMVAYDREHGNAESVANFSTILFTDNECQPLLFSIRPSATRARLKPLIEGGGGRVTSRHDPSESNVVKILAEGDEHSSPDYILASYIDDCVAANTLLDKCAYRVNSLNKSQAEGVTEVTVTGSTKGRTCYSNAEDEAILEYIAKHPYQYGGNKIWRRMELMKVTNHSWQSMRDHFLKKLEGRLKKYTKKREGNILLKRQKDSGLVIMNEPSNEGDSRVLPQTKENMREDEGSDTSSFDMDLYQAAVEDLKSGEPDGEEKEKAVDDPSSSPKELSTLNSSDDDSSHANSPIVQTRELRRSTRQTNEEKSSKSPKNLAYVTRSRSHEDFTGGEHRSEKVTVNKRKGKKNKGENNRNSLAKKRENVEKSTRKKKMMKHEDNKASEKHTAKENNNIEMDDIDEENDERGDNLMQTSGIDEDSEQCNGHSGSLQLGQNNDGNKNLNNMDEIQPEDMSCSEVQPDDIVNSEINDSEMQSDEMGSEDKDTQHIKKSRRLRGDDSPDKMHIVRLSSSKKRKTPVKSAYKLAMKESMQKSTQDLSSHTTKSSTIRRTALRHSRRGKEIVSDSSASDDNTSDVLPLKRTRRTPSKPEQTNKQAEACEDYPNIIETLCSKYKQTKVQICAALYVHSGDVARVEEYLQTGSFTQGPIWSSSQDKLLSSSSGRQDLLIRYSTAEINQRRNWLQS